MSLEPPKIGRRQHERRDSGEPRRDRGGGTGPEDRREVQRRAHERRRREAVFYLVERRRGPVYQWGSVAVAVTMLLIAVLMLS